jgi:hypothetical protein
MKILYMKTLLKFFILAFILFLLGMNLFQFAKDIFQTTEENVINPTIRGLERTTTSAIKGLEIATKTAISGAQTLEHLLLPPTRKQIQNEPTINTKLHGGYCYIGTDRDVRTCAYVGLADECQGYIYPTEAVCMYPELRP